LQLLLYLSHMVFVSDFAGIALAQIVHCVETVSALQPSSALRPSPHSAPRLGRGPLAAREAAQQELLPAGLGRHVRELLVLEVQLLRLEDGLHKQ
jgi:hypothetical protein